MLLIKLTLLVKSVQLVATGAWIFITGARCKSLLVILGVCGDIMLVVRVKSPSITGSLVVCKSLPNSLTHYLP